MADRRNYIPRCSTCGILHAPCPIEVAVEIVSGHRINHPGHRMVGWTPIKTRHKRDGNLATHKEKRKQ